MKDEVILKYLDGDLDESGAESLLQWINSSESNRQYFARIKNEWTATVIGNDPVELDLKKEFALFSEKINQTNQKAKETFDDDFDEETSKSVIYLRMLAAAVIVLLIYSIFMTYRFGSGNENIEYNQLTTLRGEKSQITLSDGTKIWLNSETTLRYPSSLHSKKVKVYLDGEAYFKVAKNPKRTFIVNTSTIDISVLGTSFNVRSYKTDEFVETTLEEGKISITGKVGDKKIEKPIVLKPNQQATFSKESNEVIVSKTNEDVLTKHDESGDLKAMKIHDVASDLKVSDKVDADIFTAWKDGKFTFKSENFESLTKRMERWYDIEIIIKDEDLKDKKYTGVFEKETVEQALKALSLSYPFYYKIDRNKVIISKSRI